jgi:hypothetical protein
MLNVGGLVVRLLGCALLALISHENAVGKQRCDHLNAKEEQATRDAAGPVQGDELRSHGNAGVGFIQIAQPVLWANKVRTMRRSDVQTRTKNNAQTLRARFLHFLRALTF